MSMSKTGGGWTQFSSLLQRTANNSNGTMKRALAREAARLADDIVKNIDSGGKNSGAPFEPNSPVTIAIKGSSKPLIDHGDMRNAVKSIKIEDTAYLVGISGGQNNREGESIVDYAKKNEHGGIDEKGKVTVARPFIAPTIAKKKDERIAAIKKAIMKDFET